MAISLIACSKSKQDHKCKAGEMYTGNLYTKSKELVEKSGEKWWILSAKHHLLDPDKEIEPYNEYLGDYSAEELHEWSDEVIKEMKEAGIKEDEKIHVYAGEDYYKYLTDTFTNIECMWEGEGMGYIAENLDKKLGRSINENDKEKRFVNITNLEVRDGEGSGRLVTGYAVVFNQWSEDLGFREMILPEAITEETIQISDIIFNYNHNPNWVLARSKYGVGTLNLEIDNHGLKFSFEAPNTTIANDMLELIKRGDITGCSFAFTVNPSDPAAEKWEESEGVYHRYIHKIDRLYDCSVVVTPAYEGTSVSARSKENLENFKAEQLKAEQEQRDKEAEQAEKERVDALNKKYSAMLTEIDLM